MIKKRINPLFLTTLIIFNGCVQKKDNPSGLSNQESLSLNKGDYAVEISASKLIWTGKEVSTKQHNGTLNIKRGQIIISDKGLISGDIEIDMSSINTTDIKGRGKDRLDGHLVQGHVEDTGKILSKVTNEGETKIKIEINKDIIKYCIYKGSIAVDGISLTISQIYSNSIEICIIPYTLKHTTLGIKDTGSLVNIETDMISKYVERRAQFNS